MEATPTHNYDVFVIQLTLFNEYDVKELDGLLRVLDELVGVRNQTVKPVKLVLWGSPINDETGYTHATLGVDRIEQSLRQTVLRDHSNLLEHNGLLLDVTNSTREAIRRGFSSLTSDSPQHFGDFTRLMIADNVLNAINLL